METKHVLTMIREIPDFRKQFISKAREIYSDIISFVANPKCTCRRRISKFIEQNKTAIENFYTEFKNNCDVSIKQQIKNIEEPNTNNDEKTQNIAKSRENILKERREMREKRERNIPSNHSFNINSVVGEVIEIEPDPMNYKEVLGTAKTEKWFYNGISVLETFKEEEDEEKPIWLLFFY